MRNVADQLDGIVDDLLGIIDALELGLFIKVYKILIEIEARRGEQGAGIVVQVGRNARPHALQREDPLVAQAGEGVAGGREAGRDEREKPAAPPERRWSCCW